MMYAPWGFWTLHQTYTFLIIGLYSCRPTVQWVKRYTRDCVYDGQFVFANDRYKMARQWFALPKLFSASINEP